MSIKKLLEEAKAKNTLVSVYVDSDDWEKYSLGYVDLVTDTYVRLRALSQYGEAAGFEIRSLSEIFKVENDGQYENKIEKLSQNQGNIFNEVRLSKKSSGDLVRESLQQSLEESIVIVVWGRETDDSLVGYVEKLETDLVSIRLINEFGEDDGLSTIEIDEITSLDFNTRSEQVRNFLSKNNKRRVRALSERMVRPTHHHRTI
ncbi:hypothetical protein PN36_25345 [Candidatus Thiomargarita nelsonii]|uniref:Uncharacterized protein n=1 Tax=Candidatus Thiomargarita nelsonii TaxID=1003181 RepID=A0A0A6PLY7_9GAMM|nr:hypothetical protein PN36_25345 [Candidatus Thiomargarita nelsonii]